MTKAKIYTDKKSISYKMRKKRFSTFLSFLDHIRYMEGKPILKILDVGGTQQFWETFGHTQYDEITVMNIGDPEPSRHKKITIVKGDAVDMHQLEANEFDVVFSNSVIEHVGRFANQLIMGMECRRVGKYFFLQTPNRWFPIEPHFRWPFFELLPYKAKQLLVRYVDTRNKRLQRPPLTAEAAKRKVDGIVLLSEDELKAIFPGSKLLKEKYFGFVKSFMVHSPISSIYKSHHYHG